METSNDRLSRREKWNRIMRIGTPFFGALFLCLLLIAGLRSGSPAALAAPGDPPPQKDWQPTSTAQARPAIFPAGQTAPDQAFQLEKSASGEFSIGATGSYTLQVGVLTTATLSAPITVTDQLPDGFTSPGVSPGSGWSPCTIQSSALTCVYSDTAGLTGGENLPPIQISGQIAQAAAPVITNTAQLEYRIGAVSESISDTITTTVVSADLAVAKAADPTSVEEGETVTFVITVTNNGPSLAPNVVLTDSLPATLTFGSATASQGNYTASSGRWEVGNLDNEAAATLRISATPNANTRGQIITNRVTGLTSDLYDYEADNNTASAQVGVAVMGVAGRVTDLGTGSGISGASVFLTDEADQVYSTTTTTTGYYTFTETTEDPLAPGTAIVSAFSSAYYTQTKGIILEAGVLSTLNFELRTADLAVTKTDNRTTATPGTELTYQITISNTGTYTASGLIITDTLALMTFDSDTFDVDPTVDEDRRRAWKPTFPLAPGDGITFTVTTEVDDSLPLGSNNLDNTIRVFTTSREANTQNNTALDRNTYTSTSRPSISVTKTASRSTAARGQDIIYTITVRNSGSGAATDVEISDQLSQYLILDEVTSSRGRVTTNTSNRSFTVDNIDSLTRNQTITVRVESRVSSTAPANATASNTATVRYREGTANRSATSSTIRVTLTGGSTLPGTGWGPPASASMTGSGSARSMPLRESAPLGSLLWLAIFITLLLGALGGGALFYSVRNRETQPEWAAWARKNGAYMVAAAGVFAVVAIGIGLQQTRADSVRRQASQPEAAALRPSVTPTRFTYLADPLLPPPRALGTDEPETLPDFPIPSPTLPAALAPQIEQPDTSPVNRIVIPQLGLDTVVKYVPYDESSMTWLIGGLQNEIAWMGNTSWPGLGSNTALAGHVTLRNGAEGPFRYLGDLHSGEEIKLYTEQNVYRYRVQQAQTVSDVDMTVTQPTNPAQLTLITCAGWSEEHEMYMERMVVQADLEEVYPLAQTRRTGSLLALLDGIR